VRQLENRVAGLPALAARLETALERTTAEVAAKQEALRRPFKHSEALTAARARVAEIDAQLERKADNRAVASAEPPVVPGTVSAGLPAELDVARAAMAELEAAALTDLELTGAARVNGKDDLALVARRWVDDYVAARSLDDDSFELARLQRPAADSLEAYVIDRVWALRDARIGADEASPRPYRKLVGDARSEWIGRRGATIAHEAGAQDAVSWIAERDHASHVFEELDAAAARATLTTERDKRIALGAARRATALVAEYTQRADAVKPLAQRDEQRRLRDLANAHGTTANHERRRLARLIETEWEQFDSGSHLSLWMADAGEQAARLAAAESKLEPEPEREPAPDRDDVVERAAPDLGAAAA
jgi:hypothetical protein